MIFDRAIDIVLDVFDFQATMYHIGSEEEIQLSIHLPNEYELYVSSDENDDDVFNDDVLFVSLRDPKGIPINVYSGLNISEFKEQILLFKKTVELKRRY